MLADAPPTSRAAVAAHVEVEATAIGQRIDRATQRRRAVGRRQRRAVERKQHVAGVKSHALGVAARRHREYVQAFAGVALAVDEKAKIADLLRRRIDIDRDLLRRRVAERAALDQVHHDDAHFLAQALLDGEPGAGAAVHRGGGNAADRGCSSPAACAVPTAATRLAAAIASADRRISFGLFMVISKPSWKSNDISFVKIGVIKFG